MIEYGFARKATYALEAAYSYKVRLLHISDLRLRVWPSDLVDDLIFSKNSSGCHSHDHRSHEWRNQKKFQKGSSHCTIQDRTVRPSSLSGLSAKAVPCMHKLPRAHKSLYAQSRIQLYTISRFTRKVVLCTHKSLRAHKSLTHKAVLTRTQ